MGASIKGEGRLLDNKAAAWLARHATRKSRFLGIDLDSIFLQTVFLQSIYHGQVRKRCVMEIHEIMRGCDHMHARSHSTNTIAKFHEHGAWKCKRRSSFGVPRCHHSFPGNFFKGSRKENKYLRRWPGHYIGLRLFSKSGDHLCHVT